MRELRAWQAQVGSNLVRTWRGFLLHLRELLIGRVQYKSIFMVLQQEAGMSRVTLSTALS